jgi:hypothetical protein
MFEGETKPKGAQPAPKSPVELEITALDVNQTQMTITGNDLEGATEVKIQGPSNFSKTFSIDSKTSNQIVALATDALSIPVGVALELIIGNALGQSNFPITFTLQPNSIISSNIQDGEATRLKLSKEPTDSPNEGDVLKWVGGRFEFAKDVGSELGGGTVTNVGQGKGIVNQGTSITVSGTIEVDTGKTGDPTYTKIPFFTNDNQLVLDSTMNTDTRLTFFGSNNSFTINNDGALKFKNESNDQELLVLESDGKLFVDGKAVCLEDGTNCNSTPIESVTNHNDVTDAGSGAIIKSIERANITANNAKISADGSVTTHSDVSDAGSGEIITSSERTQIATNQLDLITKIDGPGSAADNGIPRFDGITGKIIQNSNASIDNLGNIAANGFIGDGSGLTGVAHIPDDNSVTSSKIADSAVNSAKVLDNSLTASDIATNAINNTELNNSQSFTMAGLTLNGSLTGAGFIYSAGEMRSRGTTTSRYTRIRHDNSNGYLETNGTGVLYLCDGTSCGRSGRIELSTGAPEMRLLGDSPSTNVAGASAGQLMILNSEASTDNRKSILLTGYRTNADGITPSERMWYVGSSSASNRDFLLGGVTDSVGNLTVGGSNYLVVRGTGVSNANTVGGGRSYTNFSDRRVKKNIEDLPSTLNKVLELQPRVYERRDDAGDGDADGRKYLGFIAQEVEDKFPEMVGEWELPFTTEDAPSIPTSEFDGDYGTVENPGKIKVMTYQMMLPVLVKALQESHAMLLKENEELKSRLDKIEKMLKNNLATL